MKIARDAMLDVIKEGRGRLADAACIVPVAVAAGEPRNNRRAHEPLRVDDMLVAACAQRAPEAGDLPPRR